MKYIKRQLQAGISFQSNRDAASKKENGESCNQLDELLQDFTEKGEISGNDLSMIGILFSH